MSSEKLKIIEALKQAMMAAASEEAAAVIASRKEARQGDPAPLMGADNPDPVVPAVSADAVVLPVTTKETSKKVPGKTNLEGKEVKQELKNAEEKARGSRRRGGSSRRSRGKGKGNALENTSSTPLELPTRGDGKMVVAEDPDVNANGMRGPLDVRVRTRDSLGEAQKEADKLAEAKMPDVHGEPMKPVEAVLPIAEEKTPVLTDVEVTGEPVREEPGEKPRENEKAEHSELPVEVVSGKAEEKVSDADLEALYARVAAARYEYVNEDYENTNRWLKIKSFFRGIKQEKNADTEYYQAQYDNALIDLHNAELAKVRQSGLEGKDLREALAGMLKYFKYDELVNASQERTRVRAEHQGWSGKVMEMMEWVGREYNDLSISEKVLTAGVMLGLAGVTGGVSVLASRLFAGAGAAVGLEAGIEKMTDARQQKKAKKNVDQQLKAFEKNDYWYGKKFSEADENALNEMVAQDIFALDEKLQKKKRGALLRKITALGAGFGGGYFFRELFDMAGGDELAKGAKETVMNTLGGNEAVEWVKEHFNAPPSGALEAPDVPPAPPMVSDVPLETPDVPIDALTHEAPGGSGFPAEDGDLGATEQLPITPSESGSGAEIMVSDSIDTFINQDIEVQEGDSVWKIAGRLADQLGLAGEGTEGARTYFIDALKDRIGDVQLQAGETINFSGYGIDREFVENALQDAKMLTPEQMASIAENDARIAEFAAEHPDVTLTNETVDAIVRDGADAAHTDTGQVLGDVDAAGLSGSPDLAFEAEGDASAAITGEDADAEGLRTADINFERDIELGDQYDIKEYTEYFRQYPAAFPEFKKTGESYFGFIFQEHPDERGAISAMTIRELGNDPGKSIGAFDQFVRMAQSAYGNRLGSPIQAEKVYEYVARMAMLGIEHPTGKQIVLPRYI